MVSNYFIGIIGHRHNTHERIIQLYTNIIHYHKSHSFVQKNFVWLCRKTNDVGYSDCFAVV